MTTSPFPRSPSQHIAIAALLVGGATMQTGCLGDLSIGTASPMHATETSTATSTLSGNSAANTHIVVKSPASLTSTQTDLSVDPVCEHISLEANVLNPCGRITGLAYSPDGAYLASSSYDVSADSTVWRMSDGQRVARFAAEDWAGSLAIAFSNNGRYLAAAAITTPGDPGTLRLWDISTGSLVYSLHVSVGSYASALAWSPDSALLVVGGESAAVEVWNLAKGQLVSRLATGGSNHNVHFSPDGTRLLAAGVDGQARIWNTSDWSALGFTLSIADEMADASYAPNASLIASTGWGDDGIAEVRLWDSATGTLLQTLSTRATPLAHTLWTRQGTLVTNDWGGVVNEWTLQSDGWLELSASWSTAGGATGTMPKEGELGRSVALAASPAGGNLVAGGMDPSTGSYGFMFLTR